MKQLVRRLRIEIARHRLRRRVGDFGALTSTYVRHPRSSVIVQTHNKNSNLRQLIETARTSGAEEIIMIDDGSSDGSFSVLEAELRGKNEFVIRSNDIFEIRTYNRAISFTKAEFVALLQDDDIANDNEWLTSAIALLESDPKIAVVGGRDSLDLRVSDGGDSISYSRNSTVAQHYASYVNRAPFVIRRSVWETLGGFSEDYAPFQCDDVDYCIRSWLGGYRVAYLPMSFTRDIGVGGMRLMNDFRRSTQIEKNWQLVFDRHAENIRSGMLADLVARASDGRSRRA